MGLRSKSMGFINCRKSFSQRIHFFSRNFRKITILAAAFTISFVTINSTITEAKTVNLISLFKIEGFTSQSQLNEKKTILKSKWAELSSSLKSKRLYEPTMEVETKNEIIEIQAQEALFKENEIIFISSVKITMRDTSKKKIIFNLFSSNEPVIYEPEINVLSGSTAQFETNNKNYKGRGFKIDIINRKAIWVSELMNLKSNQKFSLPHVLFFK